MHHISHPLACNHAQDIFFVKYSAAAGAQRDLRVHTDGSVFSFNVLLNEPTDFDGGGTIFEASGLTVKPSRGTAIGHSGRVRHGGVAISRGERYLLVGFVGCANATYHTKQPAEAAQDAHAKFGDGAWERSAVEPPSRAQ